jgi:hypothetical protein
MGGNPKRSSYPEGDAGFIGGYWEPRVKELKAKKQVEADKQMSEQKMVECFICSAPCADCGNTNKVKTACSHCADQILQEAGYKPQGVGRSLLLPLWRDAIEKVRVKQAANDPLAKVPCYVCDAPCFNFGEHLYSTCGTCAALINNSTPFGSDIGFRKDIWEPHITKARKEYRAIQDVKHHANLAKKCTEQDKQMSEQKKAEKQIPCVVCEKPCKDHQEPFDGIYEHQTACPNCADLVMREIFPDPSLRLVDTSEGFVFRGHETAVAKVKKTYRRSLNKTKGKIYPDELVLKGGKVPCCVCDTTCIKRSNDPNEQTACATCAPLVFREAKLSEIPTPEGHAFYGYEEKVARVRERHQAKMATEEAAKETAEGKPCCICDKPSRFFDAGVRSCSACAECAPLLETKLYEKPLEVAGSFGWEPNAVYKGKTVSEWVEIVKAEQAAKKAAKNAPCSVCEKPACEPTNQPYRACDECAPLVRANLYGKTVETSVSAWNDFADVKRAIEKAKAEQAAKKATCCVCTCPMNGNAVPGTALFCASCVPFLYAAQGYTPAQIAGAGWGKFGDGIYTYGNEHLIAKANDLRWGTKIAGTKEEAMKEQPTAFKNPTNCCVCDTQCERAVDADNGYASVCSQCAVLLEVVNAQGGDVRAGYSPVDWAPEIAKVKQALKEKALDPNALQTIKIAYDLLAKQFVNIPPPPKEAVEKIAKMNEETLPYEDTETRKAMPYDVNKLQPGDRIEVEIDGQYNDAIVIDTDQRSSALGHGIVLALESELTDDDGDVISDPEHLKPYKKLCKEFGANPKNGWVIDDRTAVLRRLSCWRSINRISSNKSIELESISPGDVLSLEITNYEADEPDLVSATYIGVDADGNHIVYLDQAYSGSEGSTCHPSNLESPELIERIEQLGLDRFQSRIWCLSDPLYNMRIIHHAKMNVDLSSKKARKTMPTDHNGEEITAMEMLKSDMADAGFRVASTQLTSAVKAGIMLMLKDKGMDNDKLTAFKSMLDTDVGDAVISVLLGYGLTYAPGVKDITTIDIDRLAKEFRVNGMATGGNLVVGAAMEYILPAITNTLKNLPALPEKTAAKKRVGTGTGKRVATPNAPELDHHEEEIEKKAANAKIA